MRRRIERVHAVAEHGERPATGGEARSCAMPSMPFASPLMTVTPTAARSVAIRWVTSRP